MRHVMTYGLWTYECTGSLELCTRGSKIGFKLFYKELYVPEVQNVPLSQC